MPDMPGATAIADYYGYAELAIPLYAGALKKALCASTTLKHSDTSSGAHVALAAGWWASTAAITTVAFTPVAGNWKAGSFIDVYGIG
jgi:hypothetical protein